MSFPHWLHRQARPHGGALSHGALHRPLAAQLLELYRRLESWFGLTLTYVALGRAAAMQGATAAACAHHMAGLRLSREHGDRWTATFVLSSMMPALAKLGDRSASLPLVEELLSLAGDLSLSGYARSALTVLERLVASDPHDGPAAALYARCADLVAPAPAPATTGRR